MLDLSTGGVAELLGVAPHRIDYLIRDRKVRPPKGPTGAFRWRHEDLERAARLLHVSIPPRLQPSDVAIEEGACHE